MKHKLISAFMIALAVIAFSVSMVYGDAVYDRSVVTISTTAGTATFTNTQAYASLELKRIWIERSLIAVNTQTISRVTADGVYTQSVGSVTTAANAGSTASFTAGHMKYGDKLTFTGTVTTGAVAIIEYQVQTSR
jgi:hypothetical protein